MVSSVCTTIISLITLKCMASVICPARPVLIRKIVLISKVKNRTSAVIKAIAAMTKQILDASRKNSMLLR